MSRRTNNRGPLIVLVVLLSVILLVLLTVAAAQRSQQMTREHLATAPETTAPEETTTAPTTEPTEPPVEKIATATILNTGDLLYHERVINSGYDKETKTYNYDTIFNYIAPYVQKADYAVANLEGTLAGNTNGYKYSGYPCFNTPDESVDAAIKAGFDLMLTANNHTYDTKTTGFHRTQQVLQEKNVDYIGTRTDESQKTYIVKDINGIKVGMVCYTYQSGVNSNGTKKLNGISMSKEDSKLITSFDYDHLDKFYTQLEGELAAMKDEGADITVVYIHWGREYKTTPNSWQLKMGQAICNLGVDVIVGGHAHVVQPVTVLTNESDPDKHTLCLYSMGNAVSNIRYSSTRPAETEDGMLFTFTLAKYTDGSVIVEGADILSTWVNRHDNAEYGRELFPIVPLDTQIADWTAFGLDSKTLPQAEKSLERSNAVLAEGLEAVNTFYAEKQAEHEKTIGVTE
jgi:poly-gamma-glutamate synthesis protein (capsule biosynthesis protein)